MTKIKRNWLIILFVFLLNIVFFGLFIWGIVELSINSGYHSDILGGLLIGINLFFILFTFILLSSFLINNPIYKKQVLSFLNKLIIKHARKEKNRRKWKRK